MILPYTISLFQPHLVSGLTHLLKLYHHVEARLFYTSSGTTPSLDGNPRNLILVIRALARESPGKWWRQDFCIELLDYNLTGREVSPRFT